jgi:hypothetical protein
MILEFKEVDSDSISHSKHIWPQEENHLNKKYYLSIKRNLKHKRNVHVTHTMDSTARLELLSRTETWDGCFQHDVAKTYTATVKSRSR